MDEPLKKDEEAMPLQGEDRWAQFRRTAVVEMRPYEPGEDLTGIHVPAGMTPLRGDFVARDPAHPNDQWLVSAVGVQHEFKRI